MDNEHVELQASSLPPLLFSLADDPRRSAVRALPFSPLAHLADEMHRILVLDAEVTGEEKTEKTEEADLECLLLSQGMPHRVCSSHGAEE